MLGIYSQTSSMCKEKNSSSRSTILNLQFFFMAQKATYQDYVKKQKYSLTSKKPNLSNLANVLEQYQESHQFILNIISILVKKKSFLLIIQRFILQSLNKL